MRRWYLVGQVCLWLTVVPFVAMQWVRHDVLPPDISVSQYGVGGAGWIFSIYAFCSGAGPMSFWQDTRGIQARWRRRTAGALLAIGFLGTIVMAVVRTDPSGLQQSLNARIHTIGAVLALVFLPFGISLLVGVTRRRWSVIAWTLTAVTGVCLVLLLVSAFGVDTLGIGEQASWAFWQAAALTADFGLTIVCALAMADRHRRLGAGTAGDQRHRGDEPAADSGRR